MIINISYDAIKYIKEMAECYAISIKRDNPYFYLLYYLNISAHAAALYPVATGLGISTDSKVVEIGSGIGTRCMLLNGLFKCDVIGLEPHPKTYQALSNCIIEMKKCNPHLRYTSLYTGGESTGLENSVYDYVLSFEVLEHVHDPKKVILETYRMLKPGGKAFFSTCNYASFYEGHYRIFWNPFLSKEEQKSRISRKGLNPDFLDELNFVTKKQIVAHVKEAGFSTVTFNPVYPKPDTPQLAVSFPPDFCLPSPLLGKPTVLQRMIQNPSVAKLFSLINREYKLFIELVK